MTSELTMAAPDKKDGGDDRRNLFPSRKEPVTHSSPKAKANALWAGPGTGSPGVLHEARD
jgi:hypothetical protein